MFKKELKEKLENIFKFTGDKRRTTFDAYSQEFEQDTLFIEIGEENPRITSAGVSMRIEGELVYFSQVDKIKYGNMIKLIEQALPIDKNKFFFYDIDKPNLSSQARMQNIVERRISFVYLYTGSYNPDKGEMTSLEMDCCNN